MNYKMIDSKLKALITVCKETQNYKKLAVAIFILVSNRVDEMGVKLGIRPRSKEDGETIFQYLTLINSILKDNFKITLFKEDMVRKIQSIEIQFMRTHGEISLGDIIEMYYLYYEFRKLDIPNVFEKVDVEVMAQNNNLSAYSFLSGSSKSGKRKHSNDKLKEAVMYRFKEQERDIQRQLNESYDKEAFEKIVSLKNAEVALKDHEGGKIVIKGQLKDNIVYQRSLGALPGYFIIGAFLITFLLGLVLVNEMVVHPRLTASMSILLLLFFGASLFFLVIYKQNYKKGGA